MNIQNNLFPDANSNRYGENRRRHSLFIPELLKREAGLPSISYKNRDQAFSIIGKWSELEEDGKLLSRKESNIEAEFMTEVFGKALGYKLFSENQDSWEIEPKFRINGQECDALLGVIKSDSVNPVAIIELKGPKVNLDKDRFNGRTAVQQCWDYLNLMPECPWGIVSNIVSFRLYHRDHTPRKYELFTLQDLNRKNIFDQFFYLFHRDGLLPSLISEKSRAIQLLDKSINKQEEVGDELYVNYNENRERMINHLTREPYNKDLNKAIRITQKILDRIIFIAFCEDRGLLPQNSIGKAHENIPPFDRVTNPRWRNFKDLFYSVDKGNRKAYINPFNGCLFSEDQEVDNLELDDNWTDFFHSIGKYDFNAVVNVDVLGHLFERSINDLEKLRLRGLFDQDLIDREAPKMIKSAERKKGGIYYTPPDFTQFILKNTLGFLIHDKFKHIQEVLKLEDKDVYSNTPSTQSTEYWRNCFSALQKLKIIDPACGSGAFLIKAFDILEEHYLDVLDHLEFHDKEFYDKNHERISDFILNNNLHGVDLSSDAVEITQLALWIRSAQLEKSLTDISKNIVCNNSLITDKTVDGNALIWEDVFPDYFTGKEPGFDCVIGNPPWERIKLQEREYFDAVDPQIGSAVSAAKRRKLIAKFKKENPDKYRSYQTAKKRSEQILSYIRSSGSYPLTGKGDINYYSVFAELAKSIVAPQGRVGLLIPSGIATDFTNREFFSSLVRDDSLVYFYDFENKAPVFPDVDRRYRFSILIFNGVNRKSDSADFMFFARTTKDLEDGKRRIRLTKEDFEIFNPNTLTCPIFRSEKDAQITKEIYKRVPVLVNKNRAEAGNPWGIKFIRMFDQTNDAEHFITADKMIKEGFRLEGNRWIKGDQAYLPLYEAKSIQAYDHRAASIIIKDANWMRQGQPKKTWEVQHQEPEFTIVTRWFVSVGAVDHVMRNNRQSSYIAFKEITSATNRRTMIASYIPYAAVTNKAPLIITDKKASKRVECCLLGNLNSYILDFIARQKLGGITLNYFIVEQLPILTPDFYMRECPWEKGITIEMWISERVLKLSCTSEDMIPLAEETGFEPKVYKWDSSDRQDLVAQLDAAYFHFYKIDRETTEYILSTFTGIDEQSTSFFETESTKDKILKWYDFINNHS